MGVRLAAGSRSRAARRRGRGQVPADPARRLLVRGRGRVRRLFGLGARLFRPVRRDLPGHAARRGRRQAPVEGARHPAHDRAAARAVPRGPEPRGQQGRIGRFRCGARHEDHGRRDDPVEPAGSDRVEQGTPGGARRAEFRRLDRRPAAGNAVRQSVRSVDRCRASHANGNGSKPEKTKRKRFSRTAS